MIYYSFKLKQIINIVKTSSSNEIESCNVLSMKFYWEALLRFMKIRLLLKKTSSYTYFYIYYCTKPFEFSL